MEIHVDREVCDSWGKVLQKLGVELGDPYVVYVERDTGTKSIMWHGQWLRWRQQ